MNVLLSWSGGKDACMCLDVLVKNGHKVVCLLTTESRETGRTFGHGEKREMIAAQGESLNIPVHIIEVEDQQYTEKFINDIKMLKETFKADAIAFGDLYFQAHRDWGEQVAAAANLQAIYPLWMEKDQALDGLNQLLQSGYQAMVIRTMKDHPALTKWLGKTIDHEFAEEVLHTGICPMGEAGEYHTFVYDGPLFTNPISIQTGEIIDFETTNRIEIKSFSLVR